MAESSGSRGAWWAGVAALVLLTAALLAVRLAGPVDLLSNDQLRPAAYATDVVENDHWAVQTDYSGDVASKPPLSTWVTALLSLPGGRVTLLTLYLPCAMAVLGAALMILRSGWSVFGAGAALTGAVIWLLSPFGVKHVALARTDAMFAVMVALTAWAAWWAWSLTRRAETGRWRVIGAWVLFWLAGAAATLTKGPLGVVLGGMALVAVAAERGRGKEPATDAAVIRGRQKAVVVGNLIGVAVFLALVGGWFWWAYQSIGQPLVDKVIGRELVGHALGTRDAAEAPAGMVERLASFGRGLFVPTLYFLSRFAPWSVLTVIGVWRVVARPATDPTERRFERFCACWLVGGIALFSIVPHQRADHLLPLIPAAALLAGREGWRLASRWPRWGRVAAAVVIAVTTLGGVVWHYWMARAETRELQRSAAAVRVAQEVSGLAERTPGLRVIDAGGGAPVQFFLGTKDASVEPKAAAESLRGAAPVAVLTRDEEAIRAALGDAGAVRRLTRWPSDDSQPAFLVVLTNVR